MNLRTIIVKAQSLNSLKSSFKQELFNNKKNPNNNNIINFL
jgi:hypothetical protein